MGRFAPASNGYCMNGEQIIRSYGPSENGSFGVARVLLRKRQDPSVCSVLPERHSTHPYGWHNRLPGLISRFAPVSLSTDPIR